MSVFNSSLLPLSPPLSFERKTSRETTFLPPVANVFSFIFGYFCLLLTITLLLTGCSKSGSDNDPATKNAYYEKLTLNYQGSTGAVTFPELAEDLGYLAPIKLNYIGGTISGPQDLQTMVTGDVDFGTAFNGAVIKLKASGVPIKALIGSYGSDEKTPGSLYVLDDSPIKTARDLIGKKIAVNALGAHGEFMLKEYLLRNGLNADEVKQVELVVIPPVNGDQALRAKQVDGALYLGINGNILKNLAVSKGGLRLIFTDVQLFGNFTAGTYTLREDFIAQHPHTVEKFVNGTAKAIEWARNTPRAQVIERFKKIIAQRQRNENDQAVHYWEDTGIAATGGVILKLEFQQWIDVLVRDGQLKAGQVLAEDVYDNRFNPYQSAPQPALKPATSAPL